MTILLSTEEIAIEDFLRSRCNELVAALPCLWNSDYLMVLGNIVQDAEASNDERVAKVGRLLHAVVSLRPPQRSRPTGADDAQIHDEYELDDNAKEYLKLILPLVESHDLRARIADALYLSNKSRRQKREVQIVEAVVRAYVNEAERLVSLDKGYAMYAVERLQRAFCITTETNNGGLRKEVVQFIDDKLLECSEHDTCPDVIVNEFCFNRLPSQLIRLLITFSKSDSIRYRVLTSKIARSAHEFGKWEMARDYYELASIINVLACDFQQAIAEEVAACESWIDEARNLVAAREVHPYFYILAANRLESGIGEMKTASRHAVSRGFAAQASLIDRRVAQAEVLMIEYQAEGVKAHVYMSDSTPFDVTVVEAHVDGLSKFDALCAMTDWRLISKSNLIQSVSKEQTESPLSSLFPPQIVDRRGRVLAKTTKLANGRDQGHQLMAHISMRAALLFDFEAQYPINVFRNKLNVDHAYNVADFYPIAFASTFVPNDRFQVFARGLWTGMQGDFVMSVHFLIPQIEYALGQIAAQLLNDSEEPYTSVSKEDPPSLNLLFSDPIHMKSLERALGEDAYFALKVLLVDRFGANLRNITSHGLTDVSEFQHYLAMYLWWLTLKLCIETI